MLRNITRGRFKVLYVVMLGKLWHVVLLLFYIIPMDFDKWLCFKIIFGTNYYSAEILLVQQLGRDLCILDSWLHTQLPSRILLSRSVWIYSGNSNEKWARPLQYLILCMMRLVLEFIPQNHHHTNNWCLNLSSTTITTPWLLSHGWWKFWYKAPTSTFHTRHKIECVQQPFHISSAPPTSHH